LTTIQGLTLSAVFNQVNKKHRSHIKMTNYIRKPAIILLSLICLNIFTIHTASANTFEGELSISNYRDNKIEIGMIKLKYRYTVLLGEPLRKYEMFWESVDQFTKITNIKFRADVVSSGGPSSIYAFISPATVPKNAEWGWDVPGSPSWANLFHHENGEPISEEKSKAIFKKGFTLKNLAVVSIDATKKTGDKKKNGQTADPYQKVHDQADAMLRKFFKYKTSHYTQNNTELDRYLSDLEGKISGGIDTEWGVGNGRSSDGWISCHTRFAEDVRSPGISHIINAIGKYYYVFIKIGPLYSYHCKRTNNFLDAPVDLKINMVLEVKDLDKVYHTRTFAQTTRLVPGEVVTFADRIPKVYIKNKPLNKPELHVSVDIIPKATKTCKDMKKQAKNPFEKQVEAEEKEEWKKIAKKADSLGAIKDRPKNGNIKCLGSWQ
jgi:hypothetical protein